jgi:hypothetical protein
VLLMSAVEHSPLKFQDFERENRMRIKWNTNSEMGNIEIGETLKPKRPYKERVNVYLHIKSQTIVACQHSNLKSGPWPLVNMLVRNSMMNG